MLCSAIHLLCGSVSRVLPSACFSRISPAAKGCPSRRVRLLLQAFGRIASTAGHRAGQKVRCLLIARAMRTRLQCMCVCLVPACQVMSDVEFRELLIQGRVPATVADALVSAGLTLELFGAVAVGVDTLEKELARWIDAELLETEAVVMPLRLLFLKRARPGLLPGGSAPASRTGGPAPAVQATSWTETFAPKRSARQRVCRRCALTNVLPSDLLGPITQLTVASCSACGRVAGGRQTGLV